MDAGASQGSFLSSSHLMNYSFVRCYFTIKLNLEVDRMYFDPLKLFYRVLSSQQNSFNIFIKILNSQGIHENIFQ